MIEPGFPGTIGYPRARLPRLSRGMRGVLVASLLLSGCSCGSEPTRESGGIPWSDEGRSVVLVIDTSVLGASDKRRGAADLAWVNVLTRAFGSCDVVDALEIEAGAQARLDGRQVLVLPRATVSTMQPSTLTAIETMVAQGLTVFVEQPDSSQAEFLGLRLAARERVPLLAWPFPLPAMASSREVPGNTLVPPPLALPCNVLRYAPGPDPRRRARVAQSVANRPAVWALDVEAGSWIVLAHGLAEWSQRWLVAEAGALTPTQRRVPWLEAWTTFALHGDAATAPWPSWAVRRAAERDRALSRSRQSAPDRDLPLRLVHPDGRTSTEWTLPLSGERVAEASTLAEPARSGEVESLALLDRWRARARSPLTWSFDGERLDVSFEVDASAVEGLTLVLPRQWRRTRLVDWSATWSPAVATPGDRFARPELWIEVPAGTRAQLRAVYR